MFGTYSTNLKGPVPIATWETSLLFALTNSSEKMTQVPPARVASREASGAFSVMTTVRSSFASMLFIEASSEALVEAVAGSTSRSKVNFTSLALSGVPSWKVTPSRRTNM